MPKYLPPEIRDLIKKTELLRDEIKKIKQKIKELKNKKEEKCQIDILNKNLILTFD